jgi:3-deoxy-D-manno-octulosonic-acid transferase
VPLWFGKEIQTMPRQERVARGKDPAQITVFDVAYGAAGLAFGAVAFPIGWLRTYGDASGRDRFMARYGFAPLVKAQRKRIVFHGVSVGEVKAARPLLQAAEAYQAVFEAYVSASTPAGIGEAARVFPKNLRGVFPLDLPGCPGRFLDRVQPDGVVLLELELWPLFLRNAAKRKIPVSVVNGRISARTARRYSLLRELAARRIGGIAFFGMQTQEYAERILRLGAAPANVEVLGNVKFDGLPEAGADLDGALAELLAWDGTAPIVVGGSTHDPEEAMLAKAVARIRANGRTDLRLILVPRHVDRADAIERAITPILGRPVRLSHLRAGRKPIANPKIPIVADTIGDLESIYRFATAAFVGGSLMNDRGGQNMLEPLALGIPILHGPAVPNFQEEARLLAEADAAIVVRSEDDLVKAITGAIFDRPAAEARVARGLAALEPHKGAALRTAEALIRRGLLG